MRDVSSGNLNNPMFLCSDKDVEVVDEQNLRCRKARWPPIKRELKFEDPLKVEPYARVNLAGPHLLVTTELYANTHNTARDGVKKPFYGVVNVDGGIVFQPDIRHQPPEDVLTGLGVGNDGNRAAFGIGKFVETEGGEGPYLLAARVRRVLVWEFPKTTSWVETLAPGPAVTDLMRRFSLREWHFAFQRWPIDEFNERSEALLKKFEAGATKGPRLESSAMPLLEQFSRDVDQNNPLYMDAGLRTKIIKMAALAELARIRALPTGRRTQELDVIIDGGINDVGLQVAMVREFAVEMLQRIVTDEQNAPLRADHHERLLKQVKGDASP